MTLGASKMGGSLRIVVNTPRAPQSNKDGGGASLWLLGVCAFVATLCASILLGHSLVPSILVALTASALVVVAFFVFTVCLITIFFGSIFSGKPISCCQALGILLGGYLLGESKKTTSTALEWFKPQNKLAVVTWPKQNVP